MYFDNVTTIEDLKKAYKKWAFTLHPDRGGTNEEFVKMAEEYKQKSYSFTYSKKEQEKTGRTASEDAEIFKKIIDELLKMNGLEIELCGSWLWIGGDTKTNKDKLKELSCKWSPNKKKWYWMPIDKRHRRYYRGDTSMEDIRDKYGSISFNKKGKKKEQITA